MSEEVMNRESEPEVVEDGVDYVAALNELKQNTVTKDKYNAVVEENKKLVQALVDGQQITIEGADKSESLDELREKLFETDLNNLEYVETALKLRDGIIAGGGRDPFLPVGEFVDITSDMVEKAQHTADVLRECVDFAQGDSGIFTAELQRRTVDASPYVKRR